MYWSSENCTGEGTSFGWEPIDAYLSVLCYEGAWRVAVQIYGGGINVTMYDLYTKPVSECPAGSYSNGASVS